MATLSENSEIAVLQTQMEELKSTTVRIEKTLNKLDTKLDNFAKEYVPIETFEEFKKRRWAENTLSAVAGIVLAAIVSGTVYLMLGR